MIDTIYKTLLTIINKETQGYLTPTEFNLIANTVQQEIFREYFEDLNRDKNKQNRGLTNDGYANLAFNERQRIEKFAAITTVIGTGGVFSLPEDLYFIEENGILANGAVVDEVERSQVGYLMQTEACPTEQFPVYEKYSDSINITPDTLTEITLRYLRCPKVPNWTYFELPNNEPVFNPANPSFQDFELHKSEFANIVVRMLTYFGINLREADVVQIAETLKDKTNIKDEN